ncbi:MAG: TolC family protein [Ignavibacteriae bacterium]|nr:TolC family protein [Ignavibacteriota bacterium]
MKFIKLGLLITFSVLILSFSDVSAQEGDYYLESLIEQAVAKSPKIRELKSKYDVTFSRIEIGTNLPDPTLTLGLANLPTNSFSFTQEPMTGKIIGLSQGIPFPGSLKSKADVKAIDTAIVREEIEDLKNQIRSEVSTKYFDLQLTREEIEFAEESKSLLMQISEVAKSNFEVSKSSLHNVIQVEVQTTRVKDKIEMLTGKELSLVSELNVLLFRDETTPILNSKIKPIIGNNFSLSSLVSLSEMERPFLRGIKYAVDKSRLMEESANYDFYPSFKFGLQYTQRDHIATSSMDLNDFLSVVVGISLPINYGGNKTSKVNEAQFLQSLYIEKYNSSIQSLEQSFSKVTAKLSELISREKLVNNSLLPQAEQLLKAALADYQVAKIDFVNVIKAESDILTIKTELATIRAEYYKNLAQIEFLTGKKIIN